MSIKEIKNIDKLQKRLKSALDELEYIKKCCESVGFELEKHSFAYDHKEKNLVTQAIELNKKYERYEQALNEIYLIIDELEQQYDPIGNSEYKEIKDIVNKAMDGKNEN